jgi:hypothetical protein
MQIAFIAFIALVLTLLLSKADKLGKVGISIIFIASVFAIGTIIYIEEENKRYSEKVKELTLSYNQEKNISCNDYTINIKSFNLTSNSFVAKKDKFGGVIIPIEDCLEK